MFFQSVAVVAASLATANAHMIMKSPVPFNAAQVDSAPITADQFPCKSNLGFSVTTMNNMAVGQSQMISWKGTAVHGGGACQLSITTDTTPTKNSKYKVIASYEGSDCPVADTSNIPGLNFTLPDSIPNGKATFVWTWFSELSGGPELYMNCAPITVTGGASDTSKFDALPDMLVANIASTTCKSPPNGALKFPNPGAVLLTSGDPSKIQPPTGDCGTSSSSGNSTTPAQSSSPAMGQPSAPASAPASKPSTPAVQSSAAPSAPVSAPASKPSATGGVFAPGASSAAAGTSTTLVTVTAPAQAQPTGPSSPSAPAAAPMPSGTGTSSPSSPSSGETGGTCTTNGAVVCNGEKQFGLCNNGKVVWQDVAAGTACVNGVISKRSFNGRIARPRV